MSSSNPLAISSLPDEHSFSRVSKFDAVARNASTARRASGDTVPVKCRMMAPAPTKSSNEGRNELSSFHLSPAGITAMCCPYRVAARATAFELRKQPANVGVCPVESVKVEPFGDGRTRRASGGTCKRDAGDNEYRLLPLDSANSAPTDLANAIRDSSFHRYGKTVAPRFTATDTHVENDITSTMMTASLIVASRATPCWPHSHRMSNSL